MVCLFNICDCNWFILSIFGKDYIFLLLKLFHFVLIEQFIFGFLVISVSLIPLLASIRYLENEKSFIILFYYKNIVSAGLWNL